MHPRTSLSALLLYTLISLTAATSPELIPRKLDLTPRQAGSDSTNSTSAASTATPSVIAQGGGGEGGGEGGASGGGSNPVIAAGSMGLTSTVTSATSKAGAAAPTGEVYNARVLAMGAAGLIVGML